ncbi:MAG: DUF1611 domain-containing protein [Candidatus Thermoplasmatota archaeon]|nr:DUF1611 domain-containing protein [Euryarchaeota archaeon]MBU4032436.1 DUF1611 domain-containing protein [Candidatus Thermoplasmatota archaeon]MBU4072362.1 DUF1611 domain-containing protein [Candidatus Thermoplasmatota archaeon]MBU4144066.1 DUF1611 domain-containing protein [Candidatus Thermoplasmatota archaeon]MBU4591542.1 DUF1611 domain-containing protein [Candidatus Thermoplasmatota archaeon]
MATDGNAIVYCEGFFGTTNGKTAHGLVRHTRRYKVVALVDSRYAGKDAGMVLDNKNYGIPTYASLDDAFDATKNSGNPAKYFVNGITPDGGRVIQETRQAAKRALELGLNVDSGAHDFLSEDYELMKLAKEKNLTIRDVRKPPARNEQHFFSGKIEDVDCLKVAILGTDSAVGKRTTAWILVDALEKAGFRAEMVGTGQTAWMQGAKYGIIMDSLINDFVSGEIENAVWSAWHNEKPDVIVIEGQGSLMNPAYPGGFEILAAGRPDVIIMQHPPARKEYDGFPGYALHPLEVQIEAVELLGSKPVIAITINHENISADDIPRIAEETGRSLGLPAVDALTQGADVLVEVLRKYIHKR